MEKIKVNLFLIASGLFTLGAIIMAILMAYGYDIKFVEILPLLVLEVVFGLIAVYYNQKYMNKFKK